MVCILVPLFNANKGNILTTADFKETDDSSDFNECFGLDEQGTVINVDRLSHIIYKHHYFLALEEIQTLKDWKKLYSRIYRLFIQDSPKNEKLAIHISNYSGASFSTSNSCILMEAFYHLGTNLESIQNLEKYGFKMDASTVQKLFTSTTYPIKEYKHILSLLKGLFKQVELDDYVQMAVILLLQESNPKLISTAEYLINLYDLSEKIVERALLSKDTSDDQTLLTILGQEKGGMVDELWQFILSRLYKLI